MVIPHREVLTILVRPVGVRRRGPGRDFACPAHLSTLPAGKLHSRPRRDWHFDLTPFPFRAHLVLILFSHCLALDSRISFRNTEHLGEASAGWSEMVSSSTRQSPAGRAACKHTLKRTGPQPRRHAASRQAARRTPPRRHVAHSTHAILTRFSLAAQHRLTHRGHHAARQWVAAWRLAGSRQPEWSSKSKLTINLRDPSRAECSHHQENCS